MWRIALRRRGAAAASASALVIGAGAAAGMDSAAGAAGGSDRAAAAVSAPARSITPASAYEHSASNALITAEHVATLKSKGLVVIDGALTAEALAQCEAEIQEVKALAASEGGFKDNAQLKEIRSDRVRWLHEDDSTVSALMEAMQGTQALRETVLLLKGVGAALHAAALPHGNGKPWNLEVPTRCMLSMYEGSGAKYRAHRDNVNGGSFMKDEGGWLADREQADREITAIVYLNNRSEWDTEAEGGALRCYLGALADDPDGVSAKEVVDIAPVGGRLVLFKSRDILHEVMPCYAEGGRYAMSCWLLQDPMKSPALDFLNKK